MKISNLNISKRLGLGFGIICALLVFVQVLSITMLGRINDGTNQIVNDRMPKIAVANALLADINTIAITVRNMMLTESKEDRQRQVERIMTLRGNVSASLAELQRSLRLPKAKEVLERMVASNEKFVSGQDQLIKLINAGSSDEAKAFLGKDLRPILADYKQAITDQIKMQTEVTQQLAGDAEDTYSGARNLMIGLGIGILAFAAVVGYWITVSITRPVAKALKVANTVASGDLTSRIDVDTTDEMGQLLNALKAMNESLAHTVATVRAGTDTIATASAQVAAGSQDLSSRTEQQASSLEETASSMEELTSTVKQNADNARQANALAATASEVASKGGAVIGQVVGTMGEINASASKIVDIIGVIDGIAFQTNILALNAAVEAARAGEQGRGFAVVASEVRTLAQRSANAAKEIKSLIGDSVEKVEAGSKLVNDAGTTMQEIVESVRRVTDIMAEISAASAEQTSGIEQINQAVTQMDQVTQQNAALVEEAAAASEAMQDQAAKLAQAVSIFRVDSTHLAATLPSAVAAPARPHAARQPVRAIRQQHAVATRADRRANPALASNSADEWETF
ncbi:methyl-accepting chemotaxis protein [Noviherbaspirillum galbum]|uniref:HAMP domain-containing protein n=1 Tax=Noviherbaspirillum galbum TaxID=2709383 RepID=A0A6B3SMA0_9BURK|nr:methyl-accepting chemotaxis protein [Noviherbaspirillum galbum]NEX61568.1 HAMP domain-containing protein [Noviherbaspirillum galbum]